jgi:hypothetical protein
MENDLGYYKQRVIEADEINDNLRNVGKSSISDLMDELRDLSKNNCIYT